MPVKKFTNVAVSPETKQRLAEYRREGTWDDALRRIFAIAFPHEKEWENWR